MQWLKKLFGGGINQAYLTQEQKNQLRLIKVNRGGLRPSVAADSKNKLINSIKTNISIKQAELNNTTQQKRRQQLGNQITIKKKNLQLVQKL